MGSVAAPDPEEPLTTPGPHDSAHQPPIRLLVPMRGRSPQVASAGTWYIRFINMTRVSGDTIDYESKWATLTFQVR